MFPRYFAFAVLFAALSSAFAQPVVEFGSGAGRNSGMANFGHSEARVSMEPDHLLIEADYFWNNLLQGVTPGGVVDASPEQYLVIEAALTTKDRAPAVTVLFFSSDFQKKASYTFSFDGIADGSFHQVKAMTPIGQPEEGATEGLDLAAGFGHIQIVTKAEHGKNPWELRIRSIGVAPAE